MVEDVRALASGFLLDQILGDSQYWPLLRLWRGRVGMVLNPLTEELRMRYKVVLHRADEGISVSVPGLPGCWSEGDTEEEALANIQDAIQEYLAALDDQLHGAEVREVEVVV